MWQFSVQKKPAPEPREMPSLEQRATVQEALQKALREALLRSKEYPEYAAKEVSVAFGYPENGQLALTITAPYLGEPWNCEIGDGTLHQTLSALKHNASRFQIKRTNKQGPEMVKDYEGDLKVADHATYQQEFTGYRLSDFIGMFNRAFPDAMLDADSLLGKGVAG